MIAIFPGHCGHSQPGMLEPRINMDVASLLNNRLQDCGVPSGIYTGSIPYRIACARHEQPKIGISLHCDYLDDPDVHGHRVIYGPPVSNTFRLTHFAEELSNRFPGRAARRPHIRKNLGIINRTRRKYPCFLLEMGFLSNKYDCRNLTSVVYRHRVAIQIASVILDHQDIIKE